MVKRKSKPDNIRENISENTKFFAVASVRIVKLKNTKKNFYRSTVFVLACPSRNSAYRPIRVGVIWDGKEEREGGKLVSTKFRAQELRYRICIFPGALLFSGPSSIPNAPRERIRQTKSVNFRFDARTNTSFRQTP